jgi:hypothetical protein
MSALPPKPDIAKRDAMSALCQKQTSAPQHIYLRTGDYSHNLSSGSSIEAICR